MRFASLLIAAVLLGSATGVAAGPVFEEYLDYAVVDHKCPAANSVDESMVLLVRGRIQTVTLSKESPVGQTITMGPNAHTLWRVSTGVCHWEGKWDQGEEVTFTLWDSPAKAHKLYSRTIDYAHKRHKWDVGYDVHLPTKPGTQYYFEFTHNGGGDNSIPICAVESDDYKQGQAYLAGAPVAGKDLYFVTIAKPATDRAANLKRFLDQFDYSRPDLAAAKSAYESGKLDAACDEVLKAWESHMRVTGGFWYPNEKDRESILTRANHICDENRQYRDQKTKLEWKVLDDQFTWKELWLGEDSEILRQNDIFTLLGHAYHFARDERYAVKMGELMLDYSQDNTSPFDGGMFGGRWVAMFTAWRIGDAWDGWACALDSQGFTRDQRLAWIDYNCHMAHFAMREPSGGNHANAVADGLLDFAKCWPLYKDAKTWFDFGFDKLVTNSLQQFREDGGCNEPAMNYHEYSLATLQGGLATAKQFGLDAPAALKARLEKALAYTAYVLKPDGTLPNYGDTDLEEFRPNRARMERRIYNEIVFAARMFGRRDLLYVATAGKKGEKPAQTSYAFPKTRYYIMRSDWGGENGKDYDQARMLYLRGGYMGSHGHWDLNQVTLYAYGRPVIIDPGRTEYGTKAMRELTLARSHNVLLVDAAEEQRNSDITLHSWHATPLMDFVDNEYAELYPGVSHRRAIVFVRPDYYVMFDQARSKDKHSYGINFWLTPPGVSVDSEACAVRTNDAEGSNVLLKAASPAGLSIATRDGTVDMRRELRNDIPVVTFRRESAPEAAFTTVMYPFPAGAKAPRLETRQFDLVGGTVCTIGSDCGTDTVFYMREPGPVRVEEISVSFEGRAGLIRQDSGARVAAFAMVEGKSISSGGIVLAQSRGTVAELSVEYAPDRVRVSCSADARGVRVACLGRTRAEINGREVAVKGDYFECSGRWAR